MNQEVLKVYTVIYFLRRDLNIMKIFFLIFYILFSSSLAFSQVNIESKRVDSNKFFSFLSETGIKLDKGNVKTLEIDLNKRIDLKISENNKILLLSKYSYGEADNKKFKDEFYSHIRLTSMIFFKNRFGIEEFFQIQKNEFYDLSIRQVAGFSTRTHLYKSNSKVFNSYLGIGIMKEWEELINDKNNENIRSTNYITFITETKNKHKIISVTYYQPLFVDYKDYRIISENTIIFVLNKFISLKNSLSYQFDSNPPKNINENNISAKMSFILSF